MLQQGRKKGDPRALKPGLRRWFDYFKNYWFSQTFHHTKKYICIWSRGSWLTPKKEAEEEEEETTKVWSQWKETTLRVECTQAALWLDSRRMTKKEPNHLKSQDHCSHPSYFLLQAHSPRPEGVFSWPFGLWILWYKPDMVKCLDLPENCWWHLLWHHLTATPRA